MLLFLMSVAALDTLTVFLVNIYTINHVVDVCCLQTGKGRGKTRFTIETVRLNRLPIVDFMPQDYGHYGQQFGFEMGPVCFS